MGLCYCLAWPLGGVLACCFSQKIREAILLRSCMEVRWINVYLCVCIYIHTCIACVVLVHWVHGCLGFLKDCIKEAPSGACNMVGNKGRHGECLDHFAQH